MNVDAIISNYVKNKKFKMKNLIEALEKSEIDTENTCKKIYKSLKPKERKQLIKEISNYYFNKGKEAFKSKNFDTAKEKFQKSVDYRNIINSGKETYYYYLGRCFWELKVYVDSKKNFEKISENSSYYSEAQYFLGLYYKNNPQLTDYQNVLKYFRNATQKEHDFTEEAEAELSSCILEVPMNILRDPEEKLKLVHTQGKCLWDKLGDDAYKTWKEKHLPKPKYLKKQELSDHFENCIKNFTREQLIQPSLSEELTDQNEIDNFTDEFMDFLYQNVNLKNLVKPLLDKGILYTGEVFEVFFEKFFEKLKEKIKNYKTFIEERKTEKNYPKKELNVLIEHYLGIISFKHDNWVDFLIEEQENYRKEKDKNFKIRDKSTLTKEVNKLIIRSLKNSQVSIQKSAIRSFLTQNNSDFEKFLNKKSSYKKYHNWLQSLPGDNHINKFNKIKSFSWIDFTFYLNFKFTIKSKTEEDIRNFFKENSYDPEYFHLPDTFVYQNLTSPSHVIAALKLTHRSHVRYVKSECYSFFTNPKLKFKTLDTALKKRNVAIAKRSHTHAFQRIYCIKYGAISEELTTSEYGVPTSYIKGFRKYEEISNDFIATTALTINQQNTAKNSSKIDAILLLKLIECIVQMREDTWIACLENQKLKLTLYQQRTLLDSLLPFAFCNYYLESYRNPAHLLIHPLHMRHLIEIKKQPFVDAIKSSPMSGEKAVPYSQAINERFADEFKFFTSSAATATQSKPITEIHRLKDFTDKELEALKLFRKMSLTKLKDKATNFWGLGFIPAPDLSDSVTSDGSSEENSSNLTNSESEEDTTSSDSHQSSSYEW